MVVSFSGFEQDYTTDYGAVDVPIGGHLCSSNVDGTASKACLAKVVVNLSSHTGIYLTYKATAGLKLLLRWKENDQGESRMYYQYDLKAASTPLVLETQPACPGEPFPMFQCVLVGWQNMLHPPP